MKSQIPQRNIFTILTIAVIMLRAAAASAVEITLNPTVQYQTILGWGAASYSPPWVSQSLREALIREAVNELGLTRLRLELPSGNRSDTTPWEGENDDWDPMNINWSGFDTLDADKRITEMVIPFKQAVEANGDPFNIYVSPSFFNGGSSGAAPDWLLNNPGEYAEFALAYLMNLKSHGVEADLYCILNEAGNNNPFNASVVARMIKTLGSQLEAAGLSTRIQFPESISAQTAWNNYIQSVMDDDDVWSYVGCLSYHLYGTNDPFRSYIRDLGVSLGLPTAQTEYMNLNMNHFCDDLVLGGVSYWEIYGIGQCFEWNPNNTSFGRIRQYWNFRQVMHYVRPGAVRIEANSEDSNLRVLAFANDKKITVVLINGSGSRTANIHNLPIGMYGVCQSVNAGVYQELGLQAATAPRGVGDIGAMTVAVPSNTVMTIYAHPGGNLPPSVTDFKAHPDYLTQSGPGREPPSTTTLSASATDPENDVISYTWSVTSRPDDADVSLTTPHYSSTSATGLTVAGEYVFTVEISDGLNVVTRDVAFIVHADNQPPVPIDVHNRLPVIVTLPDSSTQLRCGGLDPDGDPLSYRWTLIDQPPGASASLADPTSTNCQVTGMTIEGDYVFEVEVSDPTHTVSASLTVTVYPLNPSAPTISSATASPATIMPGTESTRLQATTRDADGDPISHWWSIKTKPASASPVFSAQGSPSTDVTGLTEAGTYVFTLHAVDRTRFAKRDVTVTVVDRGRN